MATLNTQPSLLVECSEGILVLTMHRPQSANAIDSSMACGLVTALENALRDPDIRAVILTGSGSKVFCAGRDLKRPTNLSPAEFNHQRRRELQAYTDALLAFDKPLVVALNGAAMGAGTMLALHADQIVATPHAYLSLPEIDIGISPFLGHALVAEVAGNALANDLMLTARRISADEALHNNLLHAVVSSDLLGQEAQSRARLLASKPTITFQASKRWILQRRREAVVAALKAHEAADARAGS
jgi:enoyl-CoA hydratase/carnithine racemase